MLLTRPAFWYLPDPRFARCWGGFGPKLDPSSRSITTRWFDFVKARDAGPRHSPLGDQAGLMG